MTLPKKNRRRIVVDETRYVWTVAKPRERIHADRFELTLPLRIEQQDTPENRIRAKFNGTGVDFLFSGRAQSLSIRPRIVRMVIEEAIRRGWPTRGQKVISFDNAEQLFPGAVVPFDAGDEELRAACEQWFVPYPKDQTPPG